MDAAHQCLHRPVHRPPAEHPHDRRRADPVQAEIAYRRAATAAGSGALLSQAYVDAPGHRTFTSGEMTGAPHTLERRLDTGRWDASPEALNSRAQKENPATAVRYPNYHPGPYPRPYDLAHPADIRTTSGDSRP
nr:hypothetical protein [Streptomyces coffeae]